MRPSPTDPLQRELARRRGRKPLTPGDVHEIVASVAGELTKQGMTREEAAGLIVRAAERSTRG